MTPSSSSGRPTGQDPTHTAVPFLYPFSFGGELHRVWLVGSFSQAGMVISRCWEISSKDKNQKDKYLFLSFAFLFLFARAHGRTFLPQLFTNIVSQILIK
jgi:hypothetical protein